MEKRYDAVKMKREYNYEKTIDDKKSKKAGRVKKKEKIMKR